VQGKPSRQVWIAAIAVSIVCVAGLVYALVTDWNTTPEHSLGIPGTDGAVPSGSGFGLGLLIGIGAGVVIGSLLAIRKR
jgi:hypothetical protein